MKHVRHNGAGGDAVHRDPGRRQFQGPGAGQPYLARLGGRVIGPGDQAQYAPGRNQDDAPEPRVPHGWRETLRQNDGAAYVQLRQIVQVFQLHILQQVGPDHPRVMHKVHRLALRRDGGANPCRRVPVREVRLVIHQALMGKGRRLPRDVDHLEAVVQKPPGEIRAYAPVAACDHNRLAVLCHVNSPKMFIG